jgi:hypothetical protein
MTSATLIKFAFLPAIITALYSIVIYKKAPAELKILCWFIFLSALIQLVSAVLWFQSRNNLWLLHIYIGTGFLILAKFYDSVFKGFINKRVIWISAILFALFTVINAIFIQGIFTYASKSLTIESILIIILSLSTFVFLLDDMVRESKAHLLKSLNWINSGLFLYYSSSLLLFYFGDFLTKPFNKSFTGSAWVLHFLFLTIMHICFFIGLWNRPKS